MKKLRFYLGRFLLNFGLTVMPFEAGASISYNVQFLKPRCPYYAGCTPDNCTECWKHDNAQK